MVGLFFLGVKEGGLFGVGLSLGRIGGSRCGRRPGENVRSWTKSTDDRGKLDDESIEIGGEEVKVDVDGPADAEFPAITEVCDDPPLTTLAGDGCLPTVGWGATEPQESTTRRLSSKLLNECSLPSVPSRLVLLAVLFSFSSLSRFSSVEQSAE